MGVFSGHWLPALNECPSYYLGSCKHAGQYKSQIISWNNFPVGDGALKRVTGVLHVCGAWSWTGAYKGQRQRVLTGFVGALVKGKARRKQLLASNKDIDKEHCWDEAARILVGGVFRTKSLLLLHPRFCGVQGRFSIISASANTS